MSYQPSYDKGDWKAVCDDCGKIFKASYLKHKWDGTIVCKRCFEYRQPQDFVRGVADIASPTETRPESRDQFAPGACTPLGQTCFVGYAVVGCSTVGKITLPPWFDFPEKSSFT